jgi:uncharacterized protein
MSRNQAGIPRRAFIGRSLAGLAGLGAVSVPFAGAIQSKDKPGDKAITRKLGRTGLVLPIVSMGVMNADNDNLVRAALDAGLIHLDTAHAYQRGRNEEMIGRVIKGRPRDSFVIATKVPPGDRFLEMLDVSLGRLGLEYVDILYVHGLGNRDMVIQEECVKNSSRAKKSGKARFIGISTHGGQAEVIKAMTETGVYDVVLTGYNFREKNLAELDAAIRGAARAGIGIVAMKTQGGVYWDKARKDPINMTAALKWALSNPDITTAIPGFTTFDQLAADAAVMKDVKLTDDEKKDLRLGVQTGGLYCQQCGTCLPQCPKGLPIPDLMRSYMYAYGYRNLEAAHGEVSALGLPANPCGDCGSCRVNCPSAFDVRDKVTDIARIAATPAEFFG